MDADVWDVYSTLPGGTILRGGAGTYTESSSPYYGASSAFTYERIRASTGPEQDLITRIWTISEANILRRPFPISWDESHRSTLSPMPPTLTSNMRIPTWTPSMVIEDGKYDREPDLWPWENEFIYETAREREEAAKQKKKDITIGVSVAAGVIVLILAWRLWALARRRRSVKKLRDLGVDSDVQGLRTFFGLPRKGDAEEEVAAAEAIEMKKFEVPLQTQRNESDAAIVRDPATNRTSMEITMVTSRGESVETTRAARSDMEIPLEAERPNAPGRP